MNRAKKMRHAPFRKMGKVDSVFVQQGEITPNKAHVWRLYRHTEVGRKGTEIV